MREFIPPHDVYDFAIMESMVDTLFRGEDLPPIVVNGDYALTGSHRIAAYEEYVDRTGSSIEISYVEIDDEILKKALEVFGVGSFQDIDMLCEFYKLLYNMLDDYPALKAALEDQF